MRIMALAVALLLGLTASAAHAGKGIFEAPMVSASSGAEVPGSEGKIERDGIFKVEIPTADPGTYTLCVHQGLPSIALGTTSLADAGELKFEGDLSAMTLVAPYFVIHSGTDCSGADAYLSGLTLI
jgi:hypothetical protein